MPKKVVAYRCEFSGCRYRTLLDRKAIERHEKHCFINPARKSCRTCRHDHLERDEPETGSPGGNWCDLNAVPPSKNMVVNCALWGAK